MELSRSLRTGLAVAAASVPFGAEAINANIASAHIKETPVALTANAYLNDVGPALPTNVEAANKELNTELSEEGPDSGLAQEIATGSNIHGANIAKYVKAGNVVLTKKLEVTNKQFPGDVGLEGQDPIRIANPHPVSIAYEVGLKNIPKSSDSYTHEVDGVHIVNDEVIRGLCVNALFGRVPGPKPKKSPEKVTSTIKETVTFGVNGQLEAKQVLYLRVPLKAPVQLRKLALTAL
jgi:hypothetical protein